MAIADIRRRRLAQLLRDEFTTRRELADAMGIAEENYISQLLNGKKSFGEKTAEKIEKAAKKPKGWLSVEDDRELEQPTTWPFSFDRTLWDRLPAAQKRDIEATFLTLVLGASVQVAATPAPKRRA